MLVSAHHVCRWIAGDQAGSRDDLHPYPDPRLRDVAGLSNLPEEMMLFGLWMGLCRFPGVQVLAPPVITDAGTLSGVVVGSISTVSGESYTGSGVTLSYQWQLGGVDISGATSSSYTPVEADDGASLACEITATNSAGSDVATTPGVTVAYAAPSSAGNISSTLTEGVAGSIDFAAQVSVSGDDDLSGITWSLQSGTIPTGMTLTDGVVSGAPTSPQSVAALVLRATNSGGFIDVTCNVNVVENRLYSYAPTSMVSLDFENSEYSSEIADPESGLASDYLTVTRSGTTYAIQADGTIASFASNTPILGKFGDDKGLIRTNNQKNWLLNSFNPDLWQDDFDIAVSSSLTITGHSLVDISSSSLYYINGVVDSSSSWASGAKVPIRAFFINGHGNRFRIRFRDVSSGNEARVTVIDNIPYASTETIGAISDMVVYQHGSVNELCFNVTLSFSIVAANALLSVGTGIADSAYMTTFSGAEIGSSNGVRFTSIIKTQTSSVTSVRDVIYINSSRINSISYPEIISFELSQNVVSLAVAFETTDSIDTAEWRVNTTGTSSRISNDNGAANLLSITQGQTADQNLIRGYFGGRYGISVIGQPIYSEQAISGFDFSPTAIYIGGSSSGVAGVVKHIYLSRGQIDPTPLRITYGIDFNDKYVTIDGEYVNIEAQIVNDDTRVLQSYGNYPLHHLRVSAQSGDYAVIDDTGIKFRSEMHISDTIMPNVTHPMTSYEFIVAVEPHTQITGTYPFFVIFQLKDAPDSGEIGSSPPLAIRIEDAANFVLQTRTSAVEDVGTVATPSETVEHQWAFVPWQAHHIVLDWIDGRGEATGLVRMWLNGTMVVNESKVTGYNNDNECYPKWGVYAGPESGTTGAYTTHFMNFRVRRDGVSWSESPNSVLPASAETFGITMA